MLRVLAPKPRLRLQEISRVRDWTVMVGTGTTGTWQRCGLVSLGRVLKLSLPSCLVIGDQQTHTLAHASELCTVPYLGRVQDQ
jgi:hypothetical protein